MPNNLITIGKMTLNVDYIQHIFEDPDEPGTWVIISNSPMARNKDFGPSALPTLVFSGEEGEAVAHWVKTYVSNLVEVHKRSQRPHPIRGERSIPELGPKEMYFSKVADEHTSHWDENGNPTTNWDDGGPRPRNKNGNSAEDLPYFGQPEGGD